MRTILICPEKTQRTEIEEVLTLFPEVEVCKSLEECPHPAALTKLVRAWVPDLVFLSIEGLGAESVNEMLATDFPELRRVAVHSSENSKVFRKVIQWRMHELVTCPVDCVLVQQMLHRISDDIVRNPRPAVPKGRVLAFAPAKAGAGASTIAANASWAMGEVPDAHVLLADFDSQSGITGFLFNLEHEFGVDHAVGSGKVLDEEFWNRLVKPASKNIDLLLAGSPRLGDADDPKQVPRLIDFARDHYTVINADLPDSWDSVALAVLQHADQILLVTTPEVASLRIAHRKAALLRKLNLADKAVLLVNRANKSMDLQTSEIEDTVGLEVRWTAPSDYRGVSRAILQGEPAACLRESMQKLAQGVLNRKPEPPRPHRFIEHFTISPLRFSFR